MILEKKERNSIIESSLKKFSKYAFISYDYVDNFIEAIVNEEKTYDGIDIGLKNINENNNVALYVELKLKDYLYLKICRVAQDDADVLLNLIEDTQKHALLVFKRMNVKDTNKCENYVMDAINNYDGLENFNTYLTRYLMAKIKGIPYVREEKVEKKPEEQAYVPRKYNKKPPKKPKDKNKKKKGKCDPSVSSVATSEEQKVAPVEEAKSISNEETFKTSEEYSGTRENVEAITSYEEPIAEDSIVEVPIAEVLVAEEVRVEENLETIEEVVNELNESIIDLTLFDCGFKNKILLPKTIYDEFIRDIDKTTTNSEEEAEVDKNTFEEQEIVKEDKVLDIQEMYAKCQKLIGRRRGNATKGTFLGLATSVDIIDALPTSNEQFLQYLILRFSRINDSYFDIEEIMELLGVELKTVLSYEKIVIDELKIIIDKKFNTYSLMKLKKELD